MKEKMNDVIDRVSAVEVWIPHEGEVNEGRYRPVPKQWARRIIGKAHEATTDYSIDDETNTLYIH